MWEGRFLAKQLKGCPVSLSVYAQLHPFLPNVCDKHCFMWDERTKSTKDCCEEEKGMKRGFSEGSDLEHARQTARFGVFFPAITMSPVL